MKPSLIPDVCGRFGRCPAAVLVWTFCALLAPWPLAANPSHPVVKQGSATFSTKGSQLTITTTANSVINWSSFNIGAGQTTLFIEPSSTSVVWNHISDPNPTQILGHLDANGYVVLQSQSGFFIGGNAVINAAGLLMTTTPAVPKDVFGAGSWDFTAPPPSAKIINYGEINAGPAGSVFLISHDIENSGTINAPGGNIGLCAGRHVLISTRADGRGFSSEVTLPEGSVDNSGRLIADAGTITLNAQVVNQGGLIQANSVQERNGVIEVVASDSVTLDASSTISAAGDSQGVSQGGQITIKGGKSFADAAGSVINVSGGAQGGAGGKVEISAPQINAIHSQINGQAQSGWSGGDLMIDPQNITLISSGSTATSGTVNEGAPPTTGTLTLNPNSFDSFSQILLQATGNITLSSAWTVPDSATPTTLTLQAGNNIILNSSLTVGQNWSVSLVAGANFTSPTGVTPNANKNSASILLTGSAGITSANGSISLIAGNGITVGTGAIQSTAGGAVLLQSHSQPVSIGNMSLSPATTPSSFTIQSASGISVASITAGEDWTLNLVAGATFLTPTSVNNTGLGSLTLTGVLQTQNGDINVTAAGSVTMSGSSTVVGAIRTVNGGNVNVDAVAGNVFTGQTPNGYTYNNNYYTTPQVSGNLGGISTAAGGNVTITAGGNITSYLPTGSSIGDAGCGAFGPEPGVVTVTAGGSVFGHYIVTDSEIGGLPVPSSITALNGNVGSTTAQNDYFALSLSKGSWIVNAPNGSIFLQEVRNPNGALNDSGYGNNAQYNNVFTYDPLASVTLNAGNAVVLTGAALPRPNGESTLPCIYPPSLTINAGPGGVSLDADVILFPSPEGELTINTALPAGTPPNPPGATPPGSFVGNGFKLVMSDSDATRWLTEATFSDTDHASTPIQSDNPEPVVLNIAGDLDDISLFMPKETQATIGGNMNNVNFTGQNLNDTDVTFFHVAGDVLYQNIYSLVTLNAPLTLPPALYPGAQQNYLQLLTDAVINGSSPGSADAGALLPSLDLFYIPSTRQLGYYGQMDPATEALLTSPTFYEKTYTPGGQPVLNPDGTYKTTSVTLPASLQQAILTLYTASQSAPSVSSSPQGLVIGGPGQLDITAQSMDLGAATKGISSQGPYNNHSLAGFPQPGAAININLTGDLDMFASMISSWFGGPININVDGSVNAGLGNLPFQGNQPNGIWSSSTSDVSVIARGDINVAGSRIAAFDGGNVFVESLDGDVNAGTGNLTQVLVNEVVVNPNTHLVSNPEQPIAGSGIMATTLPDAPSSLAVGDITVLTPRGNINAQAGGITQESENGNPSLKPKVTLKAGTFSPDDEVIYVGDVNAGDTGVIAVNSDITATGNVTGLFISTENENISGHSLDITALAGKDVSLSAVGTITGTIIGGTGISIGSGSFTGVAMSQTVSGGGAVSALASAAGTTAGSANAAAGEASLAKPDAATSSLSADNDDEKKHHPALVKYTGRVTVLLPPRI
jgi:filamentous hemagglutinin family protein